MTRVSIHEAKTHLLALIAEVEQLARRSPSAATGALLRNSFLFGRVPVRTSIHN